MTTEKIQTNDEYLRESLRELDPNRYLISLFAKKRRQEALWALFLFNHEISKTRFVVTETQLGLIRLQWWREEIVKLYDGLHAPDNPVLQGLETALRYYGLPRALFDNLLFAREFDLQGVSPDGIEGLINYADLTTTPLNKMALQIAGDDPSEEGVQSVSIRYTLVHLLRNKPFYDAHGLNLIVDDVLEDLKFYLLSPSLHGLHPKGHKFVQSNSKMDHTHKACDDDLKDNKKIKLHSALLKAQNSLANIYLKQLRKVEFDMEHDKLKKPPMFKELRVWMST